MIDWMNSEFLSSEGMWRFTIEGYNLEVLVAGYAERPAPERVVFAKTVEKNLDDILKNAIIYLNAFVDLTKLESQGKWYLQALEFGRREEDPADEFVILFTLENDIYGFWYVKHKAFQSERISPIAFEREQR